MNASHDTIDHPALHDLSFKQFGPLAVRPEALRALDMTQLLNLRIVLHTASEVLTGYVCQPRFSDDAGDTLNPAGALLDEFIQFLQAYELAAVATAVAARPTTVREREDRAWTLLGYCTSMRDGIGDMPVLACQLTKS